MKFATIPLGEVCAQDRASVRAGERSELRYLGMESIEPQSGALAKGELSKTPDAPEANSFLFTQAHVLYGKLRPYLNKVHVPAFDGKCSTELVPLRPSKELRREYLAYFLRAPSTVEKISQRVAGARMPRADMNFVMSLPIPLPPQSEQRRIVDLLSHAENIVRMRREAEARAKEIIPALFVDMFGDPARNERGWEIRPLSDLVKFVSGGTPSKSRADYWQGPLPWVSPKDMKVPEIFDAEDHISDQVPAQTSIKLIPPGAVLIVVRGMILVHTAPVAITRVPATINQDMKALLVGPQVSADYLMWLLGISQEWLLSLVTTAAHGTRKIDTARLEELQIPVPPREIQETFVQRVLALISVMSGQSHARLLAEHTFQSLLAGVFGET